MKLVSVIFNYIILTFIFFIVFIMFTNYQYLIPNWFNAIYIYIYIASAILYILVYNYLLKTKLVFYENLTHELTHLLFALITFKKIITLHVTTGSGLVQYEGKKNFIITLSPYFYPFVTVIIILISTLLPTKLLLLSNILITVSYTSFLIRLIHDFSFNQPDIIDSGRFFSTMFIVLTNFIFFIFVIHMISDDIYEFNNLFSLTKLLKSINYG